MKLTAADVKWLFEKLRSVDFLSYHSEEELTELVQSIEKIQFGDKETIIRQGQRSKAFYIIRSGSVTVWAETPDGREHLADLTGDDSFGEVSILTGEVCNASVTADGDADLFVLRPESLRRIVQANPILAEKMAFAVAERKGVRVLGLDPSAMPSTTLAERVKTFFGLSP
ncbi:MAG: cyclic nucleotide-binding domain-containing protein [Elusimicrobiota bacterium]